MYIIYFDDGAETIEIVHDMDKLKELILEYKNEMELNPCSVLIVSKVIYYYDSYEDISGTTDKCPKCKSNIYEFDSKTQKNFCIVCNTSFNPSDSMGSERSRSKSLDPESLKGD